MRDGIEWEGKAGIDDLVVGPRDDVGLAGRKLGLADTGKGLTFMLNDQ